MRQANRIAREREDVADAQGNVAALEEQLADLNAQFGAETAKLEGALAPDALELEEVSIPPKKSDITVHEVCLVWQPSIG
jgi:hypothetical protein